MNNKHKKHISCAVAAALALTCAAPAVPASAASYRDTNRTNYEKAVDALSDAGIINGYSDLKTAYQELRSARYSAP